MDAFLVRFAPVFAPQANRAALALGEQARSLAGVTEVLPALTSTMVRFDIPETTDRATARAALQQLVDSRDWLALPDAPARRAWTLPLSFDGDDAPGLAHAAEQAGISETRAVEQILAAKPRVLAIGFAPGQPYMGLLPENWDFPRQGTLSQVPAGALVAAIRQLVLFANPSPTGWVQVARTSFRPFTAGASDPTPLRAGDEIRFARASADELAGLADHPLGGATQQDLT
tara:strand:+ start:157266 stop:157955 length:690 start_codon:yes stop_codon:yes gene_type:complete